MPEVKMLVSRTDASRGETLTVDGAEAERMIAAGQAELVRGKKAERAVKPSRAEKALK